MTKTDRLQYDCVIVGSGIAGLTAALQLAEKTKVLVITKCKLNHTSTSWAQGGIASVTDINDTLESHIQDTLKCGHGLCKKDVVEKIIKSGPSSIQFLQSFGVEFDLNKNNQPNLSLEGGHSHRRILHHLDQTGLQIQNKLITAVKLHPNITIIEDVIAIDLIKSKNVNKIIGIYCYNPLNDTIYTIDSQKIILATGGAGKAYLYTTNPDVATGDGIAMAYRAGAKIKSMEFFQFHPTCLYHQHESKFLLTEALRGEGAILKSKSGERFMERFSPDLELAPRDIVARSIDTILKATGDDYVLLDLSHLNTKLIQEKFPNIYNKTKSLGIDISYQPIPVVPAAHYCCGGVATTVEGKTTIPNLYAIGETSASGLHGANRLASNSLLEGVVMGRLCAEDIINSEFNNTEQCPEWDFVGSKISTESIVVSHNWDSARRTMWNLVGIVRSNQRLKLALETINFLSDTTSEYYWKNNITKDIIELRNIICNAYLIIHSSLARKESRGLNYNLDYPETDNLNYLKEVVLTKNFNTGEINIDYEAV